ncbi:MAG TPA: hypothetical protein VLA32_07195 [Anaerolineales bacterium]|nr:hypothetical protein [Anaerolineales bacterium]
MPDCTLIQPVIERAHQDQDYLTLIKTSSGKIGRADHCDKVLRQFRNQGAS